MKNITSLSFVVLSHGIVALLFALVFLLESFGIAMPLLSLETQHPNFVPSIYSQTVSLFAAVGIATFAVYEIFFFPSFLKNNDDVEIHKKVKILFVSYHILWCIMITYVALLDGTAWNAWLSVFVMFGFTFWGAISNKNDF